MGPFGDTIQRMAQVPFFRALTTDELRLISAVGNLFARVVLGLQTRDVTAGYKAFRSSALAEIYVRHFAVLQADVHAMLSGEGRDWEPAAVEAVQRSLTASVAPRN